ncbi:segregation and condensation protein A [Azospirillum sp. A39]|uniref:segregation and condensation protein A n=1 Tax=Azospirillum sp. A39 TaxID=3462279 RepID=UPI0040457FAA
MAETGDGGFGEDAGRPAPAAEQLVLDLDGFEGPIDMLLALARDQKVDLTTISILQLADQYLAFIAEAGRVRLELAADYLVMAAWLAYLKSRLLLPEPDQEEPPAEEMAAALAFQLQRLEAMKEAAARLMARPRLGIDVFPRGAPEDVDVARTSVFQVTLYDLLRAYGQHKRRKDAAVLHVEPMRLYSIEDAVQRLSGLLGRMPDWTTLQSFLPVGGRGTLLDRSALAAHFAAALELVKAGQAELRQDTAFGPIWVRPRAREEEE